MKFTEIKIGGILMRVSSTHDVFNNVSVEKAIANLKEMAEGLDNPTMWIGKMGDEITVQGKLPDATLVTPA